MWTNVKQKEVDGKTDVVNVLGITVANDDTNNMHALRSSMCSAVLQVLCMYHYN